MGAFGSKIKYYWVEISGELSLGAVWVVYGISKEKLA
jgi:hypothetical protein